MEFGLYVSPVKGCTVPRFGAPRGTYIGARRVGKQLEWNEERIVAIPADECRRFRAEYDGAIADGGLKRRTADEYRVQQEAREKAKKEAREKPAGGAESAPQAARIHAIAETGATAPAPTDAERPEPLLLDGSDR